MVVKKVYRLIKPQPEIELIDDDSKFLKISLISLAGIGVGIGAALIYRNMKLKRQAEHEYYMDRLEEYIESQAEFERQEATKKKLQDDLEEKVEEFNSRRICHENCEDASPGEIEKHINSIKDDKENMKIDTDEYKSVEYENYEDDIEE